MWRANNFDLGINKPNKQINYRKAHVFSLAYLI